MPSDPLTNLPRDVLKRRIEAARLLRGISQIDLDARCHQDGLGKQEAGRLERGELPLTRVRADALIRNLRVPERWLTSEDVDGLVGWGGVGDLSPAQQRVVEETFRLLAEVGQAPDAASPPKPQEESGPDQ